MPFITDETWKPSTYRIALNAWQLNSLQRETDIMPRKAKQTAKPKHSDLSKKLRSLLTWRAMASGSDWTSVAANDNSEPSTKPNVDSLHEVRPRVSEIISLLKDIEMAERREAKLGGGGDVVLMPIGEDVERGQTKRQGRKQKPDCIIRVGRLHFSNGAIEEPAVVRDEAGKVTRGSVRIALGGLTRVGPLRPRDIFRHRKGAANDNSLTAGKSLTASPGAFDFVDPLADQQTAVHVRKAVGSANAGILDHALVAATFGEIGERLGFVGKTAERRGKAAVIAACGALEKELAA
ncbi:hypothetical protein [Rhizobium sp. NXC24]|uniref:hypothetical protein n=1 Tax=Rhizobium sp. NXC24 TaxID=2048897 RepID=UPI000CDF35FC|nr:hypothetical protein [Rhizobium sp. NXC24]AVA21194.1 hypothetical protein NXC24_CH01538 [Rhizobium sp. NXC24]